MLKIHFFNVAEGDSILMEYEGGSKPYRVLVDTGRSSLPESAGSLRQTASRHLRKLGIEFIDTLILTHLHVDHIQDLPEIMKTVRFGCIYSTWFPPDPTLRTREIHSELKAVRELPQDLNTIAEGVQIAERSGTELMTVTGDTNLPIDSAYGSILIRMPSGDTLPYQNAVCSRLFTGDDVPEDEIFRAAKLRNSNSLRILVRYAGKVISLDGDYLACDAENEVQSPCDILKVAHHGDKKSMTDKLASMLRPKYAVISCMREYVGNKDRPSKTTAEQLRKYGAEIFYTDCFAEEGRLPQFHSEVLITVRENGEIRVN